jgi:glutaredoxin
LKKIIAIAFLMLIIQSWGDIKDYFLPREGLSYSQDADVVLYTATWCGYCTKTKNLLNEMGVTYQELDVEHSRQGREQFQALGGRGVPLLTIGKNVVRGYDPDEIRRLLTNPQ